MSSERKAEKMRKARSNSLLRGAAHAVTAAIVYLLIPYALMTYLLPVLPDAVSKDGLEALLGRWFVGGVPLVAVGFLATYFGKGSTWRLVFRIVQVVLKLWWFLYLINYGDLSGIFAYDDSSSSVAVDLTITGLLSVYIVLACLKLLVAYGDHRDNRADYMAEHGAGDDGGSASIRVSGRFD